MKEMRERKTTRSLLPSAFLSGISVLIFVPVITLFSPFILFLVVQTQLSKLAVRLYCRYNCIRIVLVLSTEPKTSAILNRELVPLLDSRAVVIEPSDSRRVLIYFLKHLSDANAPFILFVTTGRKLRPIQLGPIIKRQLAGNPVRFDNLKAKIKADQQRSSV